MRRREGVGHSWYIPYFSGECDNYGQKAVKHYLQQRTIGSDSRFAIFNGELDYTKIHQVAQASEICRVCCVYGLAAKSMWNSGIGINPFRLCQVVPGLPFGNKIACLYCNVL